MNAAAIMRRDAVTVGSGTVSEIAGLLLDRKISAVPVIDDEHRVIGIVRKGICSNTHLPAAQRVGQPRLRVCRRLRRHNRLRLLGGDEASGK